MSNSENIESIDDSISKKLEDWNGRNKGLLEHVSSLPLDGRFEYYLKEWLLVLTEIDKLSAEGIKLLKELRDKIDYTAESLYERQANASELANEIRSICETNASYEMMKGPGIIDGGIPEPYPFEIIRSLVNKLETQTSLYQDIEDSLLL